MKLVIEITTEGELSIYSESDVDLTLIDWKEAKEREETKYSWDKTDHIKAAEKELLHKTTGLKQVYP